MFETVKEWLTVLAPFATPLVVAVLGYYASVVVSRRGSADRMIGVAVDILKSTPAEDVGARSLRDWAKHMLNQYSGVRLPEAADNYLTHAELPSPQPASQAMWVGEGPGLEVSGRNELLWIDPECHRNSLGSLIAAINSRVGGSSICHARAIWTDGKQAGWHVVTQAPMTSGEIRVYSFINGHLNRELQSLAQDIRYHRLDAREQGWELLAQDASGALKRVSIPRPDFDYNRVYTSRDSG